MPGASGAKLNGIHAGPDPLDDVRLDPIPEAVEAFRRGECVVVVDDLNRENEGDLIVAASACTTETMAFVIRHSRCVPPAQQ